jgi:hypothetical protein
VKSNGARGLIELDDVDDVEDFRAAVAQWQALGGKSERYARIIAARLDGLPGARVSVRDKALLALATCCPAPSELQRAIAMVAKLSRYETGGRWLRDRAYDTPPPKYGPEDRALFEIMQASPGSGAPHVTTIRGALARARRVAKTLAVPLGNDSADLVLEATANRSEHKCQSSSRKTPKRSPCSPASPTMRGS